MIKPETLIEQLHKIEQKLNGTEQTAIKAAVRMIEGAVPSIDLLQARMEKGAYLAYQHDQWWFLDKDGNDITGGKNIRDILLSLIWLDS